MDVMTTSLGKTCTKCNEWKPLSGFYKHKRDGRHAIGNLIPLCQSCNSSKRDKTLMEFRVWKMRNITHEPRRTAVRRTVETTTPVTAGSEARPWLGLC